MDHSDYTDQITKRLINQGYEIKPASLAAHELTKVDDSIWPLVEGWLVGKEADYSVQEYAISKLMKTRGMTYPAALLTIDWFIKEPDAALC